MRETIWWHIHENQTDLARFLVEIGKLDSVDDVLYFFEKPWKWDEEYRDYRILLHDWKNSRSYLDLSGFYFQREEAAGLA